jgi:ABC-type Fe3+-hydroxamate transport system, periplasmic component
MSRKRVMSCMMASMVLLAAVFAHGAGEAAAATKSVKVSLDGRALSLESQPVIVNGRTLVPYSNLVSALGGKATWNETSKTVTATAGNVTVKLTIGSKTATVNGNSVTLDVAPTILNQRTYVPLRFISEAFGKWVSYDKTTGVSITSKKTITTSTGPVTLTKKPSRIVTLSTSDTEIVYALGGSVVGRPTSTGTVYPPEAASAVEVGTAHGISFEKLASVKPDLVIASPALKSQESTIRSLGAEVIFNSHNTYPEIQNSVRMFGAILGAEEKAEAIIQEMDQKLAKLTKPKQTVKTLIVYGAPGSFVVALPTSYPGNFLELAGGQNVADSFPKTQTMPQYAEFSLERIIAANPDLILFITHGGDPDEIKSSFKKEYESNSAWKNLSAVKNDRFEVLPADLFAANPGIRAPEAIVVINQILHQVK